MIHVVLGIRQHRLLAKNLETAHAIGPETMNCLLLLTIYLDRKSCEKIAIQVLKGLEERPFCQNKEILNVVVIKFGLQTLQLKKPTLFQSCNYFTLPSMMWLSHDDDIWLYIYLYKSISCSHLTSYSVHVHTIKLIKMLKSTACTFVRAFTLAWN